MVNVTPSATRTRDVEYYIWAVYDAESLGDLDQTDTITCGAFLSTVDLTQALLVDNSDGSEITTTILLNVVTVSGAATDAHCTLFVYGRKA